MLRKWKAKKYEKQERAEGENMMFIPYVCCGDGGIAFTEKLVKALAPHSGIIELGIPFSDPIADGKTIQRAANRALAGGASVQEIFGMVMRLRKDGVQTPFVFMTYYNVVYAHGREKFLRKMKEAGVQGIIVPDLPFEEDEEFEKMAQREGIAVVNLIAPNTKETRAGKILAREKLFTYLVSVAGTTGARGEVKEESVEFVKRMRRLAGSGKKLCVGFGVADAQSAQKFRVAGADGVIVGSRIIDICEKESEADALMQIGRLAREIRKI